MSSTNDRVGAIIVGAQKCGTSTLFEALSAAPGINPSLKKELNFWSQTQNWRAEIDRYHALFADRSGLKIEASPAYTMFSRTNAAIYDDMYAYNPKLKLFYLTRKPMDRMRSAYRHSRERGFFTDSFAEFLNSPRPVAATRYASQIQPFISRFGREKVMILELMDLTGGARARTFEAISEFLGVDLSGLVSAKEVHANNSARRKFHHRYDDPGLPLRFLRAVCPQAFRAWALAHSPPRLEARPSASPEEERAFLSRIEEDIAAFEALAGRQFPHWREP